jgi:hypothetical protein
MLLSAYMRLLNSMVGRELKMVEMKEEIKKMKNQ